MATTTYSLRMDEGLKKSFDEFCESVGLTATAAINLFAKKTVTEQRIPFEIKAGERIVTAKEARKAFYQLRREAKKNGLQNMTLDDINEEIRLAREERKERERKAREEADEL